jgi:phosphatidylglycerol:prolipoprotein diacylglycerol transferase
LRGIDIDIDPTIVHLGFAEVRWYGVFFALAIAAGVWLGLRELRRKGFDEGHLQPLVIWAVAGGLVGARLFHVVDRWDLYASDPLRVFALSQGGVAVYGGLIGGSLAVLAYALRHGLPVWRLGDAAAPGMIFGQAIGRLACIPDGDAYGSVTNLPWAFVYRNPNSMLPRDLLGVPTQPYVAYEILLDLALLALLWRLRAVFRTDGQLFLTYAVVYSAGRFLLGYMRMERVWIWGLQEAQVVAMITLLVALALLLWRSLRLSPTRGPVIAGTVS